MRPEWDRMLKPTSYIAQYRYTFQIRITSNDRCSLSLCCSQATAKDGGLPSKTSEVDVSIDVKESNNKPPIFRQVSYPMAHL
jgi:hypothetical protein